MTASLPVLTASACALAALTWWRPVWALGGLLAALPLLIHRTSTGPGAWLAALVLVVELTYALRERPGWTSTRQAVGREPLLLLAVLFAVAALASLSSLPLVSIWREYVAALQDTALAHWTDLPVAWAGHGEGRREFPITSAALTAEAVALMLIVWREARRSSSHARLFARALVAGTTVSVALGLLELAHLVNLDALRGTVGVFVRPGTMQSTAGNPGWFTQYVAYALPYGLVLLEGRAAVPTRRARLAAFVALMLLALVLGYQRGGWITGVAVTLWTALAARAITSGAAGRAAATRPRLWPALAAAVVVAGLAVAVASRVPASPAGDGAPTLADYATRLSSIASGDRLPYQRAGVMLWQLHPVLGGGHESFAYRYHRYFESPGGPYETSPHRVPDASSAHSLYMQTLAGTGAVGLLILLALFAVAGWTTWRAMHSPALAADRRAVLLGACGSLLAIALYGLVQEVFYVHALRLLCFVGLGLVAGSTAGLARWPPRTARALSGLLAAAFAFHLAYEYAWADPGRLLGDSPMGLYDEERVSETDAIRWTADEAAWPVPAGASTLRLEVRSLAPFPQELRLEACRQVTRLTLADHDWHLVTTPLTGCGRRDHVRMQVVPPWRPAVDGRLLGVMTSGVTLR